MKKVALTLIFLACGYGAFAQNITMSIGSEKIKWLDFGNFVMADEKAFYTSDHYEEQSSSFTVTKYSSTDMTTIYRQKVKAPTVNDKECLIKSIVLVDGDLVLFSTQYDKSNKINRLYATKFSPDGTLTAASKLMAEIKTINKELRGFFRVDVSENKKSIVVLTEIAATENENMKFIWKVIDKDLNSLNETTLELPYFGIPTPSVQRVDYRNNKVYFIAIRLKDAPLKTRDRTPSLNKLYCYDFKNSKLTERLLDVEAQSLFDIHINLDKKDRVILTGLYSIETNRYMFFETTKYNRIESGAICEVLTDNLETVVYSDNVKKMENGYMFYLKDVLIQDDGTIIIISEHKDNKESEPREYNCRSMTIHAFNPDAKTKWIRTIQKEQHDVVERNLFSTISLSNGKDIAQLINDNRKNTLFTSNQDNITFRNFEIEKNAQTKVLLTDNTGKIKEIPVSEFANLNIVHCNIKARISQSEVIVSMITDSGNKYAKISFR